MSRKTALIFYVSLLIVSILVAIRALMYTVTNFLAM